jgi:hypothetical protein
VQKKPTIHLSKLDAAKRQLETAIRLWFHSGDPVSVHTLAAASHQLLHDLAKRSGISTLLRGAAQVKPEYRKEYVRLMSSYENFFKHADRDPERLLKFNPAATEFFLFDAIFTYQALTTENPPLMSTFKFWALIHHPYIRDEKAKIIFNSLPGGTENAWTAMEKAEFLVAFLPTAMRTGTV